jgi:hypothetical protein
MARGDYGYDAPYALIMFACAGTGTALVARLCRALRRLGAFDVLRRRLGWRFWWGNPVAATTLLTARKPGGSAD